MARELDPCGTIGAHNRHVAAHETIDDGCARAWRDYKNKTRAVPVRVTVPRWTDAACATPRGMALFANITEDVVPDARETCRSCPIQRACLQWGVLYEDVGMWGGLTRDEIRKERHRHGIRRQEPYTGWAAPRPAGSPGRRDLAA